ncbi:MAG: type II toxin-antitoxin system MqsA family antitoxin [Turneriella sp.]
MKGCQICKTGVLHPGHANVNLNRGETVVIIKEVPANVCDNCGEYYLNEATSKRVMDIAEAAVKSGAEVEIKRYQAA